MHDEDSICLTEKKALIWNLRLETWVPCWQQNTDCSDSLSSKGNGENNSKTIFSSHQEFRFCLVQWSESICFANISCCGTILWVGVVSIHFIQRSAFHSSNVWVNMSNEKIVYIVLASYASKAIFTAVIGVPCLQQIAWPQPYMRLFHTNA